MGLSASWWKKTIMISLWTCNILFYLLRSATVQRACTYIIWVTMKFKKSKSTSTH